MPIFYLIMGHLLGDFVFQPNSLIKWKFKSWKGTLVHSFVISFFSGVLLFPYLGNSKAWLLLGLMCLGHFAQDCIKVAYMKTERGAAAIWPFFIDQMLHILLICLLGAEFNSLSMINLPTSFLNVYLSENLVIFGILDITFTFALDILKFELYRVKHGQAKYHRDYCGIVHRLLAFVLSFAAFLIVVSLR